MEHGAAEEDSEEEDCACVQRACASCAGEQEGYGGPASGELRRQIDTMRPGGAPMDVASRRYFEPRFAADLASVRIHTGAAEAQTAERLNARAFTVGQDIFFGDGEYQPATEDGRRLLAHELTHTLQRPPPDMAARQPLTVSDPDDEEEREADRVADELLAGRFDSARSLGTADHELMGDWLDDVWEGAEAVGEAVVEGAETVGEVAVEGAELVAEGAEAVGEAVVEGATWLATEAGSLALASANALAEQFGGSVLVGPDGLVIVLPEVPLCPRIRMGLKLPAMGTTVPLVAGGFTAGPITVMGSIGLAFSLTPTLQAVLGPCALSGVRIALDPLSGRYSAAGTLTMEAALSALGVARAGLRGAVDVIALVPIGGVPVPVPLGLASIEGGGQLALRLTGGGGLALTTSLTYADGVLSLDAWPDLALGGAIDLDLGAYAQLVVLGHTLCQLVWPLWHWEAGVGRLWSMDLSLAASADAAAALGTITSEPIPFAAAVQGIDRTAPGTDCQSIDLVCAWLRAKGLLPSQKGVVWTGHPLPKVPTPCNTHPDAPYLENPLIDSGARCRGACGPDCLVNCEAQPDMTRCANQPDGNSHLICVYKGVQSCGTHLGCRNHDHCYDWCAANGYPSILDTCHRWCDFGCICDHGLDNCLGWIIGLPPFDGRMTYYDETISIIHGPFPGACVAGGVGVARVQQYLALQEPVEIVTALAEAPATERLHLAADPWAVELLQSTIGPVLWPVARRILDGAASVAVPSLDEATWFLADQAILAGDLEKALRVVLNSLGARGIVNRDLATWSYRAVDDEGDGATLFDLELDEGAKERRARAPVEVEIYTPGFTDVGWLFSTMMHEYVHVLQVLAGYPTGEFGVKGKQLREFVARDEVEAYLWEIEHAVGSGLINSPAQMRDVDKALEREFEKLTPALKGQYKTRYDAARARVREVLAGNPPMSIDEARRILRESSLEIAELVKKRPDQPSVDAQIEAIRARRSEALVTVALVDNPALQVVQPGEPGNYRAPTIDADGRVRFLHGGIQVAWHLAATTTTAYTLGEALSAGGQMAIAGTAIQRRIHPFPPDVDFDEHIHIVAKDKAEAARLAAERIIANILSIHGGRVPGRPDIEFLRLVAYGAPKGEVTLGQILRGTGKRELATAIADPGFTDVNSFWRGYVVDLVSNERRFVDLTKVVFVTAETPDGTQLLSRRGSPDLNLAFLEDPETIPATSLAKFAWEMCCAAVAQAEAESPNWLKAAKRAYNYFSTIGDTAHMAALEPVFLRREAMVEQYATVITALSRALEEPGFRRRGRKRRWEPRPQTRILTVDEARAQVERVAVVVEQHLPDAGAASQIAAALREHATQLRAREGSDHLRQNNVLSGLFDDDASAIRDLISAGLQSQVQPVIEGAVRPVCPDKKKCRRRR